MEIEPSVGEVLRRHRAAKRREHPAEVRSAIAKLEAMGAVRPELRPVVDVALEVVKAAREEADAAGVRAELAEETLAGVRPHVDELEERAERLERNVAQRSAIDAAREDREHLERRAVEKAEADRQDWTPSPAQVVQIGKMAGQVEHLRATSLTQAEAVAKAAQLITVIHRSVKNGDGLSPVQSFREAGEWTVSDADGSLIAVCEKRSEAVQLVADLLAEELAEMEKSAPVDDTLHRPAPWRGKKKPEQPPDPGPIEYGVSRSRRKRKNSHVL